MAKKRYSLSFDAPLSMLLVLLALSVYALDLFLRGRAQLPGDRGLAAYLFSCSSMDFKNPLDYLRLFSHVLGSGSWDALLLDSLLLLLAGRSAEETCSPLTLSVMLLLSSLVAGVLACLLPGMSAQGLDPLIFMLLLVNFLASLSASRISCSWIMIFLALTAFRAYSLIGPLSGRSLPDMLKACLPLCIALAAGIAGSLPAFILRPRTGSRPAAKPRQEQKKGRAKASAAGKGQKNAGKGKGGESEETLAGSGKTDGTADDTLLLGSLDLDM